MIMAVLCLCKIDFSSALSTAREPDGVTHRYFSHLHPFLSLDGAVSLLFA